MKEYILKSRKNSFILIRWMLLVVFFTAGGNLYAQNRPVTATLQITPPYSVYLADYARPGSEQMQVYLLLRDLSEPVYDVQLRLTIEGSGIRLQTNPSYLPPPITIEGGIPLIVSGETLAPYLDSRNFIFTGITRAEYEQRRALPEGFYQFTIEVLDYRRADRSLSRSATFMAWFTLNEPPRITAPICGSTLPLIDPTHILFQWMDGGNINPASPFSTEYELTLVEVFPADRNVDDAIRSSIPLLQTTTTETSYLYGLTDAALIPGQKYAFRVRALDIEDRAVFKNDGYSEVCSFTYGEGLLLNPPDGIRVYTENARKALVNWHLSIDPDSYRVEYRRKTEQEEEALSWFSIETSDKQVVLRDLEPETIYELRVASLFNNYVSRYSQLQTFSTPEVIVAACGTAFSPNITATNIPLATAMAGQYWQVGDFEMQLREVRGGDGIFSGWGVMNVPYLSMQIPVKFDEVWVDEDYNLVQGEVVALSENLEAFQKRWEEEHPPQPKEDQEALAQQNTASDSQPDQQISAQEEVTNIIVEGEIAQLYVNEQGQVIAVDAQGQETVVAEEAPQEGEALAVEDSQGNRYTVDSEGRIRSDVSSNSTNVQDRDTLANRLFSAILDDFSQRMDTWLALHGKGPLSPSEMRALDELPACLPKDAAFVQQLRDDDLPQLQQDIAQFVTLVKQTHSEQVDQILKSIDAQSTWQDLSEQQQVQLEEAACQTMMTFGLDRVIACLAGAVIDVGLQYTFQWVGMWMDDQPVSFTDYEVIIGQLDASQVAVSAGIACGAAVLPIIPSTKNKLILAVVAGLGDGAYAMANNVYVQYDELKQRNPDATLEELFTRLDWEETLIEGGTNFAITSIATGVTLYARSNPKVVNFAQKLEDKIKAQGTAFLEVAGLDGSSIELLLQKLRISLTADEIGLPFKSGITKDDILKEFKACFDNEKNRIAGKTVRPPSEYLDAKYIFLHLAKFESGASYLVPKDILDRFGRDILGWPDNTQFVMPKAKMDDLLSKTGKDTKKIAKELGIDPEDWQGRELVRIDILNPNELNLRMPSGNEMGANPLWLPGGLLPTGYPEAVIDNIPIGKYKEIPL